MSAGLLEIFSTLSNNTATNSEATLIPVRVIETILDDSSPDFINIGGWNSIGAIRYRNISELIDEANPNTLSIAYPLYANNKQYPLKNEIVYLFNLPSSEAQNKTSDSTKYYISAINLWNSVQHNALPELIIGKNTDEINLGKTFKEKPNIHSILPYEGDIIYEGRFGQSIRFGSTVKNSKIISPWSKDGNNGDPIILFVNGQRNIKEDSWLPTLEDINQDLSSIYFTSFQTIPITVACDNWGSFNLNINNNNSLPNTIEGSEPISSKIEETPKEQPILDSPQNNEVNNEVTPQEPVNEDEISLIFPGEEQEAIGEEQITQPIDSISSDPRNISETNSKSFNGIPSNADKNMYWSVPIFNQGDSRWRNKRGDGESYDMKQAGCCQASFAMILSSLTQNINVDPLLLFNTTNHVLVYWDTIINKINQLYSVSLSKISLKQNPTNLLGVDDWLKNNGPVLMETKNKSRPISGYTEYNDGRILQQHKQTAYVGGNQHWMVIVGKNQDGTYNLHDPNEGAIRYNQSSIDIMRNISRFGFIKKNTNG